MYTTPSQPFQLTASQLTWKSCQPPTGSTINAPARYAKVLRVSVS